MLDQETIIDLINTSLPIVASSPVIIKLIKSVEKVVKTLYMPVLTFRNGKAEVDVEIYRNQNLPNSQSFTLYEVTKLKNFINSARFAEEECPHILRHTCCCRLAESGCDKKCYNISWGTLISEQLCVFIIMLIQKR